MKPGRILLAAVIQMALLAQEGTVSFDMVSSCGGSLTLDTGLAMLLNSCLAGLPWGLLRSWLRQGQEWTGGLTPLDLSIG